MDQAASSQAFDTAAAASRPARPLPLLLAALGLVLLWGWRDVPFDWYDAHIGNRPLYRATSWHYQLDKVDVDRLARIPSDVLVTDFATHNGRDPLPPEAVARLKRNPDGKPRIVLAYLSIGEAEQYRFYFQAAWKGTPPAWLGPENCSWPQAHKVRFWQGAWKDIAFRGTASYLQRIVDAGFDGVYLDRVDIYEQWPRERPAARADMIDFIVELAATAKRLKPGFLIVPQNADDLLDSRAYRRAIDGLGREDLLYGAAATGQRNRDIDIVRAESRLARLRWSWKPVFAVEYLQQPGAIEQARRELAALGYVPTVQPRALDGSDPTRPEVPLDKDTGTAEYTAAACTRDNSW